MKQIITILSYLSFIIFGVMICSDENWKMGAPLFGVIIFYGLHMIDVGRHYQTKIHNGKG